MKIRDLIESEKQYSRKEAEDMFVAASSGKYPFDSDKWGNPINKSLLAWFKKFKEEEEKRNEKRADRRTDKYFN